MAVISRPPGSNVKVTFGSGVEERKTNVKGKHGRKNVEYIQRRADTCLKSLIQTPRLQQFTKARKARGLHES